MATRVMDILEKFEPEMEMISSYLERVENYFSAKKIQDDLKVAVFLNAIGRDTYSLLRNLLAPWKLSEQSLPTLTTALKDPATTKLYMTYIFCMQQVYTLYVTYLLCIFLSHICQNVN